MALGNFVRLKLRLLGNGFRGRPSRVWLFAGGVLFGLYLAAVGFALLAVSAAGDAQVRLMVASFGGGALVLGSVLLPLVWFGIDDTLDPARFSLLPLSPRRLVLGLLAAALLSVPALALFLATTGLLVPAGRHGGGGAVAVQLVGLVAGLLLCVAAGRAVTSAFATMLRSRRVRDLAGVLLAGLAALLAPAQFAIVSAAENANWDQLTAIAQVVGWTPLGAPYTVGIEVAEGRPLAALAKLAITAGGLVGLLWWWSRSMESAMVGSASAGPTRPGRAARGGPVSQLLPRLVPGLPATAFGAIVAREMRYWWRDAKRRANVISITVVGVLVPVIVTAGGGRIAIGTERAEDVGAGAFTSSVSPVAINMTMLFVGAFATAMLANQFGFDGTSYAAHLTAGVPGRRELRARAVGHAVLIVPVLVLVGIVGAVMLAEPGTAPSALGVMLAGYGTGIAVNTFLSVLAAYPLPETSNPFATATGTGLAKSLLALVAMAVAYVVAAPVLAIAAALGDAWPWLALPVGLGYGVGAAALGCYLAGDVLERRAPELLATITPGR